VKISSAASMISAGRASLRLRHFSVQYPASPPLLMTQKSFNAGLAIGKPVTRGGFQGAGREVMPVDSFTHASTTLRLPTSTPAGSSDRRSNPARLNLFDICIVADLETTCRGLVLAEAPVSLGGR